MRFCAYSFPSYSLSQNVWFSLLFFLFSSIDVSRLPVPPLFILCVCWDYLILVTLLLTLFGSAYFLSPLYPFSGITRVLSRLNSDIQYTPYTFRFCRRTLFDKTFFFLRLLRLLFLIFDNLEEYIYNIVKGKEENKNQYSCTHQSYTLIQHDRRNEAKSNFFHLFPQRAPCSYSIFC